MNWIGLRAIEEMVSQIMRTAILKIHLKAIAYNNYRNGNITFIKSPCDRYRVNIKTSNSFDGCIMMTGVTWLLVVGVTQDYLEYLLCPEMRR